MSRDGRVAAAAATAVAVVLTACSGSAALREDDLEARLLTPDALTGDWRTEEVDATRIGGGFCELEGLVRSSEPAAEAHVALVEGETQLRHTLVAYDDGAAEQLAAIDERLRGCAADDEVAELGLTVQPLDELGADLVSYRLRVEVATVPLQLDIAAWRQDGVVSIARLTYPEDGLDDPAGTLAEVVEQGRRRGDREA